MRSIFQKRTPSKDHQMSYTPVAIWRRAKALKAQLQALQTVAGDEDRELAGYLMRILRYQIANTLCASFALSLLIICSLAGIAAVVVLVDDYVNPVLMAFAAGTAIGGTAGFLAAHALRYHRHSLTLVFEKHAREADTLIFCLATPLLLVLSVPILPFLGSPWTFVIGIAAGLIHDFTRTQAENLYHEMEGRRAYFTGQRMLREMALSGRLQVTISDTGTVLSPEETVEILPVITN